VADHGEAMALPSLYISRDLELDWLEALVFGKVTDGHPEHATRVVGPSFRWILDPETAAVLGFELAELSSFDPMDESVAEIWEGPRFDAPALALSGVTAGEVVCAAKHRYASRSTLNRDLFDRALDAQDLDAEEAAQRWRDVLEAGDPHGHYGLGYMLCEMGRHREAYAHLRWYAEANPHNAWAWCWVGKTCEEIGDLAEARLAYERALELEEEGGFRTDASVRLEALDEAHS
jgi:tetratricopeptide (TPR) repeat protein